MLLAKEVVSRGGIRRSFRNDRRTISIEEGGTCVHLAHLTVGQSYVFLVPSRLSLLLLPFPFSVTLRRNVYQLNRPRNVRFLMTIIEILLLLNYKLMAGYTIAPVVKKLARRAAPPDDRGYSSQLLSLSFNIIPTFLPVGGPTMFRRSAKCSKQRGGRVMRASDICI